MTITIITTMSMGRIAVAANMATIMTITAIITTAMATATIMAMA
jgi:hypothetical protein